MTSRTVSAASGEEAFAAFHEQVSARLQAIADDAARGGLDAAIDLVVESIRIGGVLQAFGTGHSQAFAMEIAGRAGGFIPTKMMALRDIVLAGSRDASVLSGSSLERDDSVVDASLKVHGTDALRIADASIVPTIPNAHTHATAVMIGEKAADLIRAPVVRGRSRAEYSARSTPKGRLWADDRNAFAVKSSRDIGQTGARQ